MSCQRKASQSATSAVFVTLQSSFQTNCLHCHVAGNCNVSLLHEALHPRHRRLCLVVRRQWRVSTKQTVLLWRSCR